MAKVKKFFLAMVQFIFGFASWIILSSWFNMNVSINIYKLSAAIFYVVVIALQLIGVGLAYLTFRFKVRWIGIGILSSVGLFLLGAILRSPCMPPLVLPFPLTVIGWC